MKLMVELALTFWDYLPEDVQHSAMEALSSGNIDVLSHMLGIEPEEELLLIEPPPIPGSPIPPCPSSE